MNGTYLKTFAQQQLESIKVLKIDESIQIISDIGKMN